MSKYAVVRLMLLILLVGMLAACGGSNATPTPEVIALPDHYNERYDIYAMDGQDIIIEYDITVENPGPGRVYMILRDPQGETIWHLVVTETSRETVNIPVSMDGNYLILLNTESLVGHHGIGYRRVNR